MSDPIDARAFREMVRELASEEPHPVDWERTEDALFARLDREPVEADRFEHDETHVSADGARWTKEALLRDALLRESNEGERISEVGLGIAELSSEEDAGLEDEAAADRTSSPYVAARHATLDAMTLDRMALDAIEGPRAIHHIPPIGKLSLVERAQSSSTSNASSKTRQGAADDKHSGVRRWSTVFGFVAVAAAIAFVLGGLVTGGLAPKNAVTASNTVAEITAERWVDPSDVPMAPGMSGAHDLSALRSGDMVEATSDAVSFAENDKLSWTISPGSRVLVRAGVDSPSHVLVLESGSIRADVVDVGNAAVVDPFVVEAGETRVSVRGTIFSVTRSSKGIVVDVEHGFVVVGPRNEVGIGSGRMLHESERGAFSLDGGLTFKALAPERTAMLTPPDGATDGSKRVATEQPDGSQIQAPATPSARDDARKKETQPAEPAQVGATAPVVPGDPVMTEASIKASLNRCFTQVEAQKRDGSKDDGVSVTMRSTLSLRVADDGAIKGAAFNPPLRSDLQSCAVSLLSAHVDRGARTMEIPVEIRH